MKIVIIEDHLMFREVVRRVCVHELEHEVVGEAETGVAGIEQSIRLKPDLMILDLGLPDMDGFIVAKAVRAVHPEMRILVLSGQLDDYTVVRMEKAGFNGFVDKTTNAIGVLTAALEAMAAGKTYFSMEFQRARRARRDDAGAFEKILSGTEQAVLSLVGEGLNDDEIGRRMGIATTTAQTHRSRILKKLQIKCTPKLIVFAQRSGFARMSSRSPFPARS